jgi:chaperonin GroES
MEDMYYLPLWDKVWVERIEEEETKSPGGLVLPGKENKTFSRGRVLATGCGYKDLKYRDSNENLELLVDRNYIVIFGKYAGTDLGDGTLILKEDEILAIERKD